MNFLRSKRVLKAIIGLVAGTLIATTIALSGVFSTAQAATVVCATSTPAASRPMVRPADTGTCVATMQQALNKAGAKPVLTTDGKYGPKTLAAVQTFQTSHKLKPDGWVGPLTWAALLGDTPSGVAATKPITAPARVPNPGTGWSVSYGPNHTSKVVLTYDDCAPSKAAFRAVVDQAERLGIAIVVFPYQQCANIDVAYARAHGQIVAGHSVSHANLAKLSADGVRREIDVQSRTSGVMRPPYGSMSATAKSVLTANGIRTWTWSVDTNDWQGKSRESVVAYAIANARGGDTVLMHMNWRAFNAQSVREIVSGLNAKGLQVCSIAAGKQVNANGGKIGNTINC